MKWVITNSNKKIIHLLFWLVVTLVFLYDRRYLIQKAGLDHFAACVVVRVLLIVSLIYLNLYYLIPKFFSQKKYYTYFLLLLASVLLYVTLQNLYDIYLFGYVIGDINSRDFFHAFPYNFITTAWYVLLTVALQVSLERLESRRAGSRAASAPEKSLNGQENHAGQSIFLKSGTKQIKTKLSTIIYIQGLKDYSVVVTDQEKIIIKGSLKTVEQQLSGIKKLIRVHKSYLVAEDRINVLKGGQIIIGEHAIPIGRMYKKDLEAFLFRTTLQKGSNV